MCVCLREMGVFVVCVWRVREIGVFVVCVCVGAVCMWEGGVYLHASAARLEVVFINHLQSQRYCFEYMRHSKPKHIAYNK